MKSIEDRIQDCKRRIAELEEAKKTAATDRNEQKRLENEIEMLRRAQAEYEAHPDRYYPPDK